MVEGGLGGESVGPQAELTPVAGVAVESGAPDIAVLRQDLLAEMAEIVVGYRDFENPAAVGVGVVVERAVVGGGDFHIFALPRELDIGRPLSTTAEGYVVEQGAFDVHFIAVIDTDIGGVGSDEEFDGVFLENRSVVRRNLGVEERIQALVYQLLPDSVSSRPGSPRAVCGRVRELPVRKDFDAGAERHSDQE